MYDTTLVDVLDGAHDGAHQFSGIPEYICGEFGELSRKDGHPLFVVVAFRAYTVEELAPRAQVETEVEVMCGLTDCI